MQRSYNRAHSSQDSIIVTFQGELYEIPGESVARTDYVEHDVDCPTCKDAYASYDEARRALSQRSLEEQRNKRIYRCEICGYYHFTTKPGSHQRRTKGYDRQRSRMDLERTLSRIGESEFMAMRRETLLTNKMLRVISSTLS